MPLSLSTLSRLVDSASEAMLVVDSEGRIVLANDAAERLFGYPPGQLAGVEVDELVPDEARPEHPANRASYLRAPEPRAMGGRQPLRGRRRDGSTFPARVGLSHAAEGEDGYVLAIVIDTTELTQVQEALQLRAAQLEHSNQELEQFAAVASHDLQEPLRKIRTFGERLVERSGSALDARARDYLGRMQGAAQRMSVLIDDLLTLSRVTMEPRAYASVNLHTTLQGVLSDLEVQVEETQGTVELDGLPTLEADSLQMRQLLQNLIGNALKFRREGVPPRVQVTGRTNGDQVEVTVQDNGIGFDERYRDRIFNVFQRLHGRAVYPGTGIGLALCRRIVERHGGSIEAHGTPGVGTRIEVVLPRSQGEVHG
jgi:PAS domain S-box-containing protein